MALLFVYESMQEFVHSLSVSQFIPLLSLTDTRCPLAVHVRPATKSPHCAVESVRHRITGLYLRHKAQTLLKVGANAMQTQAKL